MVTDLEFNGADTIRNKGVGTAPAEVEFTSTGTKTTIFSPGAWDGTIEEIAVAASARTPASGLTNPARLSAEVYTTIGGTETSKVYPILVWHSGETSTTKSDNLIIPINKKYTSGQTVAIAIKFVETNTNTLTNIAALANIGYTSS